MDEKNTPYYFIEGGGEMGDQIRKKNWDRTPLGDPKSWPTILKNMISMILDNPIGMYIAWGKEYTQIYNDGYRAILDTTDHSHALGLSPKETFPEMWHIIESIFEKVMTGIPVAITDFMFPLNRKGVLDICHFDFSCSPIRVENGQVGGILMTIIETTNKRKAEDQLKESNIQLNFALEAAQLGTFDLNPITNEFTANERLKRWFELPSDNNIPLNNIIEKISEKDQERVIKTLQESLEYPIDSKFDEIFTITNYKLNKDIILHAKGQTWFNDEQVAFRLNGIVEDITERTLADRKISESGQSLRNIILEAPIGICVMDADTLVSEIVNEQFIDIAGKTYDEIVGKPYWVTFAEARKYYENALKSVIETGKPYFANEVEITLVRHGKEDSIYVTFVYAPLKDKDDKVVKIAVWVVDNTKQVHARQKVVQSESNLKLMIHQAPMAIAIFRDQDHKVEIANSHALEIWGRTEEQVIGKSIFSSMPELLAQGIKDILDDVNNSNVRFAINELPVEILRNGKLETVYIKFSYEPLYNSEDKIDGIMAIGFDVTSQVLSRKKAEESEQSIRTLIENAPFPIGVYTGDEMRITLANQSIMDAWGKGNNVIGQLYTDILPEFNNQHIFEQIRNVQKTGNPFHAKNKKVEIIKGGKKKTFYFNYSFTPLFDASGKVFGVMNTAAEVTELNEAKLKIEESEKRFRNSVRQAPMGIAIFRGSNYVAELANRNYLMLVDKVEEEFLNKPLFEVLPETKKTILPLFDELMQTGHAINSTELTVTLERQGKKEDAFFNLVYHPLKEENGDISGIMVVAIEVTETVKARHLLEQSEKHFRNMVMQSPIPMTILRGEDFIIESANTAMCEKLWRKKRNTVIGRSLLEVFPELKEQKYLALLAKVFKTGITHREEESIAFVQGDDGTKKFYLDFEYSALYDSDGTISGIMITANDVTDKVEARRKVEDAEERTRLAAEATELATWELDLNTRDIIHSPRLAIIFGHDISTKISHADMRKQVHPEDIHEIVEKAFDKAMHTGKYGYEARIIKPDKTICWIRTQGKVFFDSNNKPYKKIGTLRDITEEKLNQQALQESEEKFRLLADSMPQQIWTSDPQGNLIYFNKTVFNYSGLTHNDLVKKGWITIIHPDDLKKHTKEWLESIRTGKDFLLEHRFRRHDGEYRWQLSRAKAQRDEQGTITMWVGTSTDIQDQKMFTYNLEKQVEERTKELNKNNLHLERMNKELQSFAYISSHDLQEPLRKIQTFASRIMEKEAKNLSEPGLDKFHRIQNAANRMQNLIQDLLAYSRTDTEERIFEITDLKTMVDEVKTDLKEEILQKGAIIESGKMCEVKIIPFQFRQLIFNLISNSLKFTDEGRTPLIKIDSQVGTRSSFKLKNLAKDKTYVHVSISDNGIGFEPEFKDKIFEVFQRLHGREKYNGTGIGLAIVKKIVDNHNGFITAIGIPKKGAKFDIYIPLT